MQRALVPGENMLALVFRELRPFLVAPEATLGVLLHRLCLDAAASDDAALGALLTELETTPGLPSWWGRGLYLQPPPVAMTVDLAFGSLKLSLFTTLTTMGTPTDVNVSEH